MTLSISVVKFQFYLPPPQFYSFSLVMAKDVRSIPNALTVVGYLLPLTVGPGCS